MYDNNNQFFDIYLNIFFSDHDIFYNNSVLFLYHVHINKGHMYFYFYVQYISNILSTIMNGMYLFKKRC